MEITTLCQSFLMSTKGEGDTNQNHFRRSSWTFLISIWYRVSYDLMVNLKLLFLNSSQIKVRRIFFLESAIEGRIYGGLKGCMPYALISGQCKCLCLMLETYTPHRRLQTKEDKNKTPLATSKIKVLSISLKGRLCSRDKHQNREALRPFSGSSDKAWPTRIWAMTCV